MRTAPLAIVGALGTPMSMAAQTVPLPTVAAGGGDDYWSQIRADANRRALIEYLKTL